ncbi:putative ATP binding protein [Heterostelium album PN500]|uniref:Putative ATP binding protein n=1 Tax=Heterostelium pallidum (strain ATCC 26659 / Pp 5 / PN500) TaxID=670386 RepID=D3AYT4_HETP5|nr:putative ATP binding protein [Heterostelium album PN500]EFA85624.1 putative ATP binding protein [Heterostelium album PN500]|eukprot:XP_020437731.1 putative ATP binding protein [Heterostelium album PN500]
MALFNSFKDGNASEPYYKRINGILKKYHESTILKELLQEYFDLTSIHINKIHSKNADDAGAKKVIIKFDRRSYDTEKLFDETPVYKQNMKQMQGPSLLIYNDSIFKEKDWEGIKSLGSGSKEMDLKSVGKFGLGINSVYHVSDFLTIISDTQVLIQDPLGLVSKNGLHFDFVENSMIDAKYRDQTEPWKQFGCDMVNRFNGTIIRLPIRLAGSKIKPNPITDEDYKLIFDEFIQQLHELLLFLKNILQVEVYDNDRLLFRVSVSNASSIVDKRTLVHDCISRIADLMKEYDIHKFIDIIKSMDKLPVGTYTMDLKYESAVNGISNMKYCITQGLVNNGLESLKLNNITTKLIPWGGVAVPLGLTPQQTKSFQGIPFTFLPIGSQRFNIPFHLNGFFVLSDARTDIHFSTSNYENSEEHQEFKWNENVLTNIIPELYNHNLLVMIQNKQLGSNSVYDYFPTEVYNSEKDKVLSIHTVKRLCKSKLFRDIKTLEYYHLSESYCVTDDHNEDISNVLTQRSKVTIRIPNPLLNYMSKLNCKARLVTQLDICGFLKSKPLTEFNGSVLSYLLSGQQIIKDGHLDELKVFPLSNGRIGSIRSKNAVKLSRYMYYTDQRQFTILASKNPDSLFDFETMLPFSMHIKSLCEYYHVSNMDLSIFCRLLKNSFPMMVGIDVVLQSLPSDFNSVVFWEYMGTLNTQGISDFVCIPATDVNNSLVYVAPGYPKLILDRMKESIRQIALKLGFYMAKSDMNEKYFYAIFTINSDINLMNSITSNMISSLSPEEKITIRKHLLSDKRSIEHSQTIFSLPIFKNSVGEFKFIDRYTVCTNWKDITKYCREKGYVIFEGEKNNLQKWPTALNDQNYMILNYILPSICLYTPQEQFSIVKIVLWSPNQFKNQELVQQMEWVPNSGGSLSNLSQLIILSSPERVSLLKYTQGGQSKVIAHQLASSDLVEKWSPFGVRTIYPGYTNNSDYNLIYDCLKNLSKLPKESFSSGFNEIISFMNQNINIVDSTLLSVPFIPVKQSIDFGSISYKTKTEYVSINQCYLDSEKELCYSQCTIGDIDTKSLASLQIHLPTLKIETIINHLGYLIEQSQAPSFTNEERDSMVTIVEKIYKYFNTHEDLKSLISSKLDWIWCGSKFVSPTLVFVNGTSIDPYIFQVPDQLKKFNRLYEKVKIPMNPTFRHYTNVLVELYNKSKGMVLLDEDLSIAIKVAKELALQTMPQEPGKIYLPCTSLKLVEFGQIIFSDTDDVHPSLQTYSILHRDLSLNDARKLKIKTSLDTIKRGKTILGSEFGQFEKLLTRLKNINEEYKVESLLKEVVQNAEDSKATVLEICLDKRRYTITDDLDPELPKNFGNYLEPSLVIFNDSKFTDLDIQNIQSLGDSYKKNNYSKIGHYGIGFNCVYNITDVPSIITRDSLFIFDPLKSHFSVEHSAGRSYEFSIRDQLVDTFKPLNYPGFGLQLDKEFDHTIIRLPLRKSYSDLSSNVWTMDSINKLLKEFQSSAENCLLFQRSLKKITFSVIEDDNSNQAKTLYSVERRVTGGYDPINLSSDIEAYNWKNFNPKSYFMDIITNGNVVNKWFVGWKIGAEQSSNLFKIYEKLHQKSIPLGSIAICMDKEIIGVPFTYLPLPKSTELPVMVNGSFILNSSRQDVFNSLDNNYKFDTNYEPDSEKEKSLWNISIVTEILCPLYLNLLNNIEFKNHFIGSKINNFYSLFPHSKATLWNRITEYFYQNVSKYSVFSNIYSNVFGGLSYLWESFDKSSLVIKSEYNDTFNDIDIIKLLLLDECPLVLLPPKVFEMLSPAPLILDKSSVANFYKQIKDNSFQLSNPPRPSLSSKESIFTLAQYVSPSILGTPFMLLESELTAMKFDFKSNKLLYNYEYISLLPDADLFIHHRFTDESIPEFKNNFISTYGLVLEFPEFFIKYLVPRLHSYQTYEECKPIFYSLVQHWKEFNQIHYEQLKALKLIPVLEDDGNTIEAFNLVSEYYNEEVLKIIPSDYDLPPIFYEKNYQSILSKLGLKDTIETDIIVAHFEALSNNPDADKFEQLYNFMTNTKTLTKEDVVSILDEIKDLPIIPCAQNNHIGAVNQPFASLSMSSDPSHEEYTFTVLPTRLYENIQQPTSPKMHIIADHLKNLLLDSQKWKEDHKLLDLETLVHKQISHLAKDTTSVQHPLPDSTLFPIQSQLVPIKDIILTDENLLPFFFSIQKEKKFYYTLECLGFTNINDDKIVCKLSSMVTKVIGDDSIKTVITLLKHLKEASPPALLSESCVLQPHSLVYSTPFGSSDKLKRRSNIAGKLYQVHPEIERHKGQIKIFALSDLVKESINLEMSRVEKVSSSSFIDFHDPNIIARVQSILDFDAKKFKKILSKLQSLNLYKGKLVSKFTMTNENNDDVTREPIGSDHIYDKEHNSLYIQSELFDSFHYFGFISSIFQISMQLYTELRAHKDQVYDLNPFHTYSSGEKAYYSRDNKTFQATTVVRMNEESIDEYSELRFYFISLDNDDCDDDDIDGAVAVNPISVPLVHLFKEGTTDVSKIELDHKAVQQLYDEVLSSFGEGFECKRISEFAKQLGITIELPTVKENQLVIHRAKAQSLTTTVYTVQPSKYSSSVPNDEYASIFKKQSAHDLEVAKHCHLGGFYSSACFHAQQCVEKLFKAYCHKHGIYFDLHSHKINYYQIKEDIDCSDARIFERFYISTRYPSNNGYDTTAPYENYNENQSEDAIKKALILCLNLKDLI